MKQILITGGAGFIGSNLARRILSNGDRIIIIDNFNKFYNPEIKRKNIDNIIKGCIKNGINSEYIKVFEGDFRDEKFLNNVFKNNIDTVIHLGAMAGVRPSIENPKLYYDVNIMGTLNILEECRKNNIKKVIFASSSSVYGNNKKVPFSESDFVDNPISPYASSKKAGELLCYTYHHLYNISIACLRFFTVYGPGQRPDLAINKFTNLIKKGKEVPFFGDGTTSRDYTYIDDIVEGIIKTLYWLDKDEKKFDIFNLGGDKTVTLNEMVETIEMTLDKKALLNKLPMQAGDVNRTCADLTHSNEVLGYYPNTSFEDGIKKFIDWIDNENE